MSGAWRDVIYKGPNDIYYLEATSGQGPAMGGTFSGSPLYGTAPLVANTWSHLAATYDGATMRLYVNGTQVASRAQTGIDSDLHGALTIGGDSLYGQYFAGLIDEVRIYNRALTVAEIQTDMVNPIGTIGSTDANPPDVQLDQPADGAIVSDIIIVEAQATDDVAIDGVQFYIDGVLTGSLDTASPYALTWDTRTVSNGAHTLTARTLDTSGNSTVSMPVTVNVANSNYFQNEILATGFELPTNIEFLPNGDMLVVELHGAIRLMHPPYLAPEPTPFLQLTNVGNGGVQQGIFDVALDPNFATNRFFYVFYTLESPNRDRLSRFTANASLTGTVCR